MKYAAAALAALAAALFVLFSPFSPFSPSPPPTSSPAAPLTFAEQVEAGKLANAPGLSPAAGAAASATAAEVFANTYIDPTFGFSFRYPSSLKVGSSDDGAGGFTIIAQDAAAHVGFQIAISPWESGDITQEAVQRDLPQIGASDFRPVVLDGAPGLAFAASDSNFGDSIQIWLIYAGYLYQISTYTTQGPLVSKVLGTWKWTQ